MSKKKVTLIGVNYYPEDTAIGLYSTQMAEYLAKNGYMVTVMTGFPYYPNWKMPPEYAKKEMYLEEYHNGIRILRFKQYVPKTPTFFKRILHLASFTLGSLVNLFRIKKQNLVIAIVPFTSTVMLGWLLKSFYRSLLWVHVQDFEFDAAFQSGLISTKGNFGKVLYKFIQMGEKALFSRADITSSISYTMARKLKDKTKLESYYLPNWINANDINPNKADKHPYMISDRFKILYAGNIGDKQNWSLFIEYIRALESDDGIEVIVVGNGSKKQWLVKSANGLRNIKLYEPIPYGELSSLLCGADLHVLFQKEGMADIVMPSKLLGMMASGVPSLVTGQEGSEVEKVFKKSKGGYFYPNDDLVGILKKTRQLKKDDTLRKDLGENSRNYIVREFSHTKVLEQLKNKIDTVLND